MKKIIPIILILSVLLNIGFIIREVSNFVAYKQTSVNNNQVISGKLLLCVQFLSKINDEEPNTDITCIKLVNILKNLSDIKYTLKTNNCYSYSNIDTAIQTITNLEHELLILIEDNFKKDSHFRAKLNNVQNEINKLDRILSSSTTALIF